MKFNRIVALVSVSLLSGLNQAQACPVCFQSGGEERWAFYATTAFLTALPLSFVGGAVYVLRKRFLKLEVEEIE